MSTITLEVDDELLKKARFYAGPLADKELFSAALTALIRTEVGRRLIARGGSQPDIQDIPRRNPWSQE